MTYNDKSPDPSCVRASEGAYPARQEEPAEAFEGGADDGHGFDMAQGPCAAPGQRERQICVYETMLSTLSDFAFIVDRKGCLVFANQALLALWGMTPGQAEGKTFQELPGEAGCAMKLQRWVERVVETGERLTGEMAYADPAGYTGYYEYIFAPVGSADGAVEHVTVARRDISERRQRETALKKSSAVLKKARDQLEIAASAGSIGLWSWDIQADLLSADAYTARAHGVASTAIAVGMAAEPFFARIHAEDHEYAWSKIVQALARGEDLYAEYRVWNTAGEMIWLMTRAKVEYDGRGQALRMNGASADITRRKLAEEARRASEARYRALVTASSDLVYRMSPDWNEIRELNGQRFPADTGAPRRNWMNTYIHPEDRRWVGEVIDEAVQNKGVFELEFRVLREGGNQGWTYSRAVPLLDGHGEIIEWFGTAQDITERKQRAERQAFLLQLSDALRVEVDEAAIGATATRMLAEHLGADRCYITHLSRARGRATLGPEYRGPGLPSVYGQSGEIPLSNVPAVAKRLETESVMISDAANDPRLSGAERAAIEASVIPAFLAAALRAGKRNYIWALVAGSASPRPWTREDLHLVENVAERTWAAIERAGADAALHEREAQLQQANRAKDEFLAMLGHELRNPLQPVMISLDLMKRRQPDVLTRELGIIESQMRYVTAMVDDLLDVSRIARGKIELKRGPVAIADVVAGAIETAGSQLEANGQALEESVSDGLTVDGDRRRLVQVVTNLLTNAAKYSPEGKTVCISAAAEKNQAVIRVRDQGIGIAPELLPRVFDSFMQDRQSIARSQGGLGLGLAIVDNIARLHGGSAEVYSDGRDQGSEFIVRLPLLARCAAENPPAGSKARALTTRAGGDLKVLVVEDYIYSANSLAELLHSLGCDTRIASDGGAALEAAVEFRPALALIDIGLPVLDGYELARRLRARTELRQTRLVAVTGYGQENDRQRARAAGFNEYLVKPLDSEEVAGLIATLARARE